MKVVTIHELMLLPTGTIFSRYEPVMCSGLFRKMENIEYDGSVDFYYQDLEPSCTNGDPPIFDGSISRWAMYDHEEQFAVFEADDVKLLKEQL
jgi:hypothetical protein